MRTAALLVAAAFALAAAGPAAARGGRVSFDGGTALQQAQVTAALQASAFDWDVLPGSVVVHIAAGSDSRARPGEVWLDADLLDARTLAWGVVQHEFAHEFDFFFLDTATRAALLPSLGGVSWYGAAALAPDGSAAHAQLGAERFASTFAWAFWPSQSNVMKPQSKHDESAAMAPAAFRALVARLLAQHASPA